MTVADLMKKLGIETYVEFSLNGTEPEQRIRGFCEANKCGNYGKNHMCPPYVGTLDEIAAKLRTYRRGILMQYVKHLDVHNDKVGLRRSRNEFLMKALQIEKYLQETGITQLWTLVGGCCGVCDICTATVGLPCRHPEQARMPMEGLGIDVLALLERVGLDNRFHDDKVTWSACILVSDIGGPSLLDI